MSEQKVIRSMEEAQELFLEQFPNGMNGLERVEYERRMRQYFDALMGIDSKSSAAQCSPCRGRFQLWLRTRASSIQATLGVDVPSQRPIRSRFRSAV